WVWLHCWLEVRSQRDEDRAFAFGLAAVTGHVLAARVVGEARGDRGRLGEPPRRAEVRAHLRGACAHALLIAHHRDLQADAVPSQVVPIRAERRGGAGEDLA